MRLLLGRGSKYGIRLESPNSGGVSKLHLKQTTAHKQSLVRPEDDFYPLETYTRLFGCPKDSRNKKRGHRISCINGIRGVVVPGENSDKPWKLVRSVDGSIEMQEEHDNGDGSDGEVEADVMQKKFGEIVDEQEQAYTQSAVGVMSTIFAKAGACPTGTPAPPTVAPKVAHTVAVDEEGGRKRPGGLKHTETQTHGKSNTRKIKHIAIGRGRVSEGFNRDGVLHVIFISAHLVVHSRDGFCCVCMCLCVCLFLCTLQRRCAFEDAEDFTPSKSRRPASSGRVAISASSKSPNVKSSKGPAIALSAISQIKGDQDDGTPSKRGRPELDILVITERQWEAFNSAQEGDLFFGERSYVQLRTIQRYALSAGQKVLHASAEKEPVYSESKKKFQIMESSIKLQRAWSQRKSLHAAILEFTSSWDALISFCESAPVVPLRCGFIWHLRLHVCASNPAKDELASELKTTVLKKRFPGVDEHAIECIQRTS